MDHETRQAILAQRHREELLAGNEQYWWLSFADPRRPKGSTFLGVIIVKAYGLTDAMKKTRAMGINPGGEIQACALREIPDCIDAVKNRLLSEADLREADLI